MRVKREKRTEKLISQLCKTLYDFVNGNITRENDAKNEATENQKIYFSIEYEYPRPGESSWNTIQIVEKNFVDRVTR